MSTTFELQKQADELGQLVDRRMAEYAMLRTALLGLLKRHDEETGVIDVSPDAGCIECTVGTVPNDKNTGLCAFHRACAAIAKSTP